MQAECFPGARKLGSIAGLLTHLELPIQAPQYAVTFLVYDLAKAWLAADNGNGRHLAPAPKALPAPRGSPAPAPAQTESV